MKKYIKLFTVVLISAFTLTGSIVFSIWDYIVLKTRWQ